MRSRQAWGRPRLALAAGSLVVLAAVGLSILARSNDVAGEESARSSPPDPSRAAFVEGTRPGPDGTIEAPLALLQGVLAGDAATGCLWVEGTASGSGTPVLFADDTAFIDFGEAPGAVRDDEKVVLALGEQAQLRGGLSFIEPPLGVPGCPVQGQPFVAVIPVSTREAKTWPRGQQ